MMDQSLEPIERPRARLWRHVLAMLIIGFVIVSCTAPTILGSNASAQEPEGTAAAEYLIPGDSLQVFVWGHPDLSLTVPVRPDGRVSTPLIEDLQAVGKTPTQLSNEMEKILSEYIRRPRSMSSCRASSALSATRSGARPGWQARGAVSRQDDVADVMIEVGATRFVAGNRARRQSGGRRAVRSVYAR
jgi:polysaccharide export outer membrane protein